MCLQLSEGLLTAHGSGAPEFESGSYSCQSDVYSLGVVMLELLTGRKPYDRLGSRVDLQVHIRCLRYKFICIDLSHIL